MSEVPNDSNTTSDSADAMPELPSADSFQKRSVMDNLALADQVLYAGLAQQAAVQNHQALFNLQLATVAKCIQIITSIDPASPTAVEQLRQCRELIGIFNQEKSPAQ